MKNEAPRVTIFLNKIRGLWAQHLTTSWNWKPPPKRVIQNIGPLMKDITHSAGSYPTYRYSSNKCLSTSSAHILNTPSEIIILPIPICTLVTLHSINVLFIFFWLHVHRWRCHFTWSLLKWYFVITPQVLAHPIIQTCKWVRPKRLGQGRQFLIWPDLWVGSSIILLT